MEFSALGAARHYQIAKDVLSPDALSKSKLKGPEGSGPNALVKGLEDFSKVFENAETQAQNMVTGQGDAHSVVEALATAEVALEAAVTIRNRVVEAYQELLRMPV